jgi:hypothetical protein
MKVMNYSFVMDVWEKISNVYEGDNKVKKVNIKNFKRKSKTLRMKKDDNITSYICSRWMNYLIQSKVLVEK